MRCIFHDGPSPTDGLLNVGLFQDANPGRGTRPGPAITPSSEALFCKGIAKLRVAVVIRAVVHAEGAARITHLS